MDGAIVVGGNAALEGLALARDIAAGAPVAGDANEKPPVRTIAGAGAGAANDVCLEASVGADEVTEEA